MRFGAVERAGGKFPYVHRGDGAHLLPGLPGGDVGALIGMRPAELERELAAAEPLRGESVRLPPLSPGKIVAIGLNYMDHVRESGLQAPAVPLVFAKFPSSVSGDGATVTIDPTLTERVDWEVELAVVIGKRARNVAESEAREYIFGYTVANDLSARDLQQSDGQWVRAKSLDGFCPLGPEVVTADEVSDPQRLALRTAVNGELVQDSNTSEMVFGVMELIAFCSRSFTLDPGDVILTGTPWGCGEFMQPRRSLRHGDVVSVSISTIGTLTNAIEMTGR